MGKASSAKKIARAARAGSASGPNERRDLGFPALVILIVVLGLALVVVARTTRDAEASPTLQDHWHNAYGIYDCQSGSFLDVFQSEFDPQGIHSHQDGLIHIHPFTASVTGKQAQLEVFLDAMGASISDDTLTFPGGETLTEQGTQCDGQPAVLQIGRWETDVLSGDPVEVVTEDLASFRFLDNLQAITIALAPAGSTIPVPPSLDGLDVVAGQARDVGVDPPNNSAVPGPQDFGTDNNDG